MTEPVPSSATPHEPVLTEKELFQLVAYLAKVPRWEPLRAFLAPRLLAHRRPPEDDSDVPWRRSVDTGRFEADREVTEDRAGTVAWNAYVLRLVLVCPRFLKPLLGFEWIAREFRRFVRRRTYGPQDDDLFWKAVDVARRALHPAGRPRNDAGVHTSRSHRIETLMASDGLKKTHAVFDIAEGSESEIREVWASLLRVKKQQDALADLLERCGLPSAHLRGAALTQETVFRRPGTNRGAPDEFGRLRRLTLHVTPPDPDADNRQPRRPRRTRRTKRRDAA